MQPERDRADRQVAPAFRHLAHGIHVVHVLAPRVWLDIRAATASTERLAPHAASGAEARRAARCRGKWQPGFGLSLGESKGEGLEIVLRVRV